MRIAVMNATLDQRDFEIVFNTIKFAPSLNASKVLTEIYVTTKLTKSYWHK